MKHLLRGVVPALTALLLLLPGEANAQIQASLGAGLAAPTGSYGDQVDNGFTVRGQVGASLLLASVHAQVGWTRFPGRDLEALEITDEDIFHAGVGARFGMGLIWLGLNAAYFSGEEGEGEEDAGGMGFFPEVGMGTGSAEIVADYRVDGDRNWLGLRLALKF